MSKTELVETLLRLPKPISDFYAALAQTENRTFEALLEEELIANVNVILDSQETKLKDLVIHLLGLEKILE